jgi:transmembrane 9 superfamily protein 3
LFIILPLTAVGTVLGRNISGEPNDPCRTNAVPRPIPEKKWFEKKRGFCNKDFLLIRFMEPNVIIFASGILPFGSIFIEM